jgi:hypothetical protein
MNCRLTHGRVRSSASQALCSAFSSGFNVQRSMVIDAVVRGGGVRRPALNTSAQIRSTPLGGCRDV